MPQRDYYEILGVGRDATGEEIKKAFRRVARETHPDANPGDSAAEAEFRAAAEAYEVLSDPERRARHDRGDAVDLSDLLSGIGGLDDLLKSVFGEGGLFGSGAGRAARGRDVLVRAEISLEEAAFGGDADVEFRTLLSCAACSGTGAEPGSEIAACPGCGGAGQVRVQRRSLFGTMMSVAPCPRCDGEGRVVAELCGRCDGAGSAPDKVEVNVEIPAGVSSGARLRLSGRGESGGRLGPPGDLFVEIEVAEDERFEQRGADLIRRARLGIAEAALGTRLDVPLIDGGTVEVEVPAGAQHGKVIRIAGRGMTVLGRRGRGDLLVVVGVVVPSELSVEEAGLLRRWAELRGERVDNKAAT